MNEPYNVNAALLEMAVILAGTCLLVVAGAAIVYWLFTR